MVLTVSRFTSLSGCLNHIKAFHPRFPLIRGFFFAEGRLTRPAAERRISADTTLAPLTRPETIYPLPAGDCV